MFKKLKSFLGYKLWDVSVRRLKGTKGFFYRILRIIYLSLHGFWKDQCTLRASALTFYTLMSLVPFLALSFAIAKAFGYQILFEQELLTRFSEQKEILKQIIDLSQNLLERTESGLLALIGVIVFLWSIIKVLNHIETSMNEIWGIKKPRKWKRKCTDYLAVIIIGPIFFLSASSTTIYIVGHLRRVIENTALYPQISESLIFLIKLLPYCIMWFLFTFLYLFMPNTKVRIIHAVLGGIIAGTAYQLFQWGYLNFQIGVSRYNAIYGSFAAIPLFLVWLQLSWITVLIGSEISFASQNSYFYEFGKKYADLSHQTRMAIALWIVHQTLHRFVSASPPITKREIHEHLQIPYLIIDQMTQELINTGFVYQIEARKNEKHRLQIAKPPENIRIADVLFALEKKGESLVVDSQTYSILHKSLQSFYELIQKAKENQRLIEIFDPHL